MGSRNGSCRLVAFQARSYARTRNFVSRVAGLRSPMQRFTAPSMRLLLSLFSIWVVVALAIGVVGAHGLGVAWRAQENRRMVVSGALIASICASEDWRAPVESDPRWAEMERRWQVDVVPIYSPPENDSRVELTQLDDIATEANTWTAMPSGQWRIHRAVALAPRSDSANAMVGVQVTLLTDFVETNRQWWLLWSLTFVFGCAIMAFTSSILHYSRSRKQSALKFLIDATNQVPDSYHARLPEPAASASSTKDIEFVEPEFAVQLSILRERINSWLGELQSELQRNELVLGNMQEGVLAVDDQARVLLANAAVIRMLDLSADEYLYRSLVEVIRAPRVVTLIERVLESSTQQEDSFEHGRQQLSLRILARPVPLGNGRVGALMTARDETLIKRIESVRRDFVTNASHELKTPLAAIRAYAETLQMGATEDPQATQTFLSGILTQADRINGLITGMLQLARVQSGTASLKRIRFDVQSEIEGCLDAAEVMAKAKQISLKKVLPAEPVILQSDPEAVQTVVSNLLSNAVRYTPARGHVSLVLESSETAITIRVQDTGIGIEKEDLVRIFERFYRVERARTTDTGGTGLGLSIVKHLVQSLGGSITVNSEPHKGSCFEVRLPLCLV